MHSIWRLKAAKLYRRWLVSLRNRGKRPDLLTESQWADWCRWWDSDEFREWSDRNRRNRRGGADASTPAPATHTAGSNTFLELAHKFARQNNGRMPTFIELYRFGHTVGNDMVTWVNASYQLLGTEYERLLELVTQAAQGAGAEVDANELYVEVARTIPGHETSRRVFGLGQFGAGVVARPMQDSAEPSSAATDRAQLDEEIHAELARLRMLYDALTRRMDRIDPPSASSSAASMPARDSDMHYAPPGDDPAPPDLGAP